MSLKWKQIVMSVVLVTALPALGACEKEVPLSQQSEAPGQAKSSGKAAKPSVPETQEKSAASAEKPGAEAVAAVAENPPRPSIPVDPSAPVATVNGKDVAGAKYYQELSKIMRHGSNIPEDRMARIRDNILKRLVEAELVDQAIQKSNIRVSKGALESAFQEYRKRFKSDAQFQNYLKHGKLTEEQVRIRIRDKQALEKLIEKQGSLGVTDKEAQAFYEKNKSFYKEKESLRARHILLKVGKDARKSEEQKVLARMAEARRAIDSGTEFGEVARKFSEGPTAPKGGDLGFFGRGQMVKPFEEALLQLKQNEISEPVRTRFGYHLIQLLEKKPELQKPFKEVKEQIFESLRNKKFFQSRRKLLERLRKDATIVRHTS